MKNPFRQLARLLFNVDFSDAVDQAFRDYAKLCENPVDDKPAKTANLPGKTEIKKSYGLTYIYGIHATIEEIEVS